ncbi:MAG TPA: UDP-galactopyranose mutase, partial [Sunxiuqinia sp.]|nr:UDP-galactopyranose mutase [Sunxiuqinia sp.]
MACKYHYLVVGAGLYGAVFAHELSKHGKKCLVLDKRNHKGGNIYCEKINGINVHKYGPHIFHTNSEKVWNYVNQFVEFNHFTYSPMANYKGELYNLPFNMNTFHQLWGVKTPDEARKKISEERAAFCHITNPKNLEEQTLVLGGKDIYEKLVKGYTEKQWGRPATEIPAFIIKRIPFRFTFNNNYFTHRYQGIPVGGYNVLIEKLLDNIEVKTGVNFFDSRTHWEGLAETILFTGPIDEFFDFKFGRLEYRSLHFETEELEIENYQGVAGMNYTDKETPFTRIVEHKHFEFGTQPTTIITREYPHEFSKDKEPYYPINDVANNQKFKKYQELSNAQRKHIFGGRLGGYCYAN